MRIHMGDTWIGAEARTGWADGACGSGHVSGTRIRAGGPRTGSVPLRGPTQRAQTPTQRAKECRGGGSAAARHREGRARHREFRGPTQEAPGERRGQPVLGPDAESAARQGPGSPGRPTQWSWHRERRSPTQSAGVRHREGRASAGARHREQRESAGIYIYI